MDHFTFTPTEEKSVGIKVPYLEVARADFAPYYRSEKRLIDALKWVFRWSEKRGLIWFANG
jgi:hypothetical protein